MGEKRLASPVEPPAKRVQRASVLPSELSQRMEGVIYALEDGNTEVLWWRGNPVVVSGDKDCICEHGRLGVECCRPPPPTDPYLKKTPVVTSGPGTSGRTYLRGGWYRTVEGTNKTPLLTCIHGGRLIPCATCGEAEAMCAHEHVFARCVQCPPLAPFVRAAELGEDEEEEDDPLFVTTPEEEEEEEVATEKIDPVAIRDPAFDWDRDFCPERHRPIGVHPWWNAEDQRRIARDYEAEARKLPLGRMLEPHCRRTLVLKHGFPFIYGDSRTGGVHGTTCSHWTLLADGCLTCKSYLRCVHHGIPSALCPVCAPKVCMHGYKHSRCGVCRRPCTTTGVVCHKCDHCIAAEEAVPMELRRLPIQPYLTRLRVVGRLYRVPDKSAKHGWVAQRWTPYWNE